MGQVVYTYEKCKEEVLKYKTRLELRKNNLNVFNAIYRNKWHDTIFSHITIVGEKHNKLTVLKDFGIIIGENATKPARYVECMCDCGKISNYRYFNLKNGHTKSCGCIKLENREKYINKNSKGIIKANPLYYTFNYIKAQCYRKNSEFYNKVGGVGIKICQRWLDDIFNFYSDVGVRPSKKHKLIRKDHTKDFEPSNVMWSNSFSCYNPRKSQKEKKITKPKPPPLTYEECRDVALMYDKKWELGKKNRKVYDRIFRMGWKELISHMEERKKSIEECREVALKYNSRVDFQKNDKKYYSYARLHNWLEDICSHMRDPLTLKKRMIYVYEFDDNHCYIGLTCDEIGRHNSHMSKKTSPVYKHMIKTGLIPNKKNLTNYISVEDSKTIEELSINQYRENGWVLLNTYKGGGTGGTYKYTKTLCQKESLKYNDYMKFYREKENYQKAILRNKWYELFDHMDNKSWRLLKLLEKELQPSI